MGAARAIALLAALLMAAGMAWATAQAAQIDPVRSRLGFSLQTRWGQTLEGRFPRYEGEIAVLADGRHRVQLRLASAAVEIVDSPRYTRFARGARFFDADRFPVIEFVSDPYDTTVLKQGGQLSGRLTIHGITRREVFMVSPSACTRPAYDCDVVARGSVRRENYGISGFGIAIHNRVFFTLNVRVSEDVPAVPGREA